MYECLESECLAIDLTCINHECTDCLLGIYRQGRDGYLLLHCKFQPVYMYAETGFECDTGREITSVSSPRPSDMKHNVMEISQQI